ncbi:CoA-transferase family III domain-containing protein [Boeremia exigua]|uniref:CoA-transferase family III domain-containing protein n=1 Tax=Boeremia exigua TaxID=749465 RepID=UPI001E8D788E|nr:CoA-transferase family III domain-containing protein [Boeremia exigua]KAH6642898.1 CoA-transferase family III domain-containing protein [Boeremia exigua]
MAISGVNGDTNGTRAINGTAKSVEDYSVPKETQRLFDNGILNNSLIAPTLPKGIAEAAAKVRFEGTSKPSIPINWRFAESISALKGLEASMINVLLSRKYGLEPQEAVINTDHAQLFFMSILLNTIDPAGEAIGFGSENNTMYDKYFKNTDLHGQTSSLYRASATNIYRCKDGRYFHLHGSMNPEPTQDSLGLPHEKATSTPEESCKPYADAVAAIDSPEMQRLATDKFKQAGTICWTADEFRASPHGKQNAHIALYDIHAHPSSTQLPTWWPESPHTSPARPLAGLKVVDLTRVIAAPALTRGLAELGASVMRVTAPHITDMSSLHVDLNWGKWNAHLDFRTEAGREALRDLVRDADVVVQGYRPGVLDKYGFSPEGLLEMTRGRERGLVVVRENCYGWQGPWQGRSGWQQISDACCGVSMAFGQAMGNEEPVTPVYPNSDFCTGTSGVIAVLNALLRRGDEGGSYLVDVALNYYSQWLVNSVGEYPPAVWDDVWSRNGRQVFRHYHNMGYTLPRFMKMLHANARDVVLRPEFFETRHSAAIGADVRCPKPIIQFPGGKVELKFNVGTRGNGVDQPRWPADLMTEIVA